MSALRFMLAIATGRSEPLIDRTLESLAPHVGADDEISVLVVDMRGRTADELGIRPSYGHWHPNVRIASPKPTIWQGSHRVTKVDRWALGSARNTAFVLCDADYIAFCDDRSVVGPHWLDVVRAGAGDARVIGGAFAKFQDGRPVEAIYQDHRLTAAPSGCRGGCGAWFYGCTFAMPLDAALAVNGHEEGCDGVGGEDYIFGLMLENAGYRIDFDPSMLVLLDRPGGSEHAATRVGGDKGVPPHNKSHAALERFGKARRTDARFTPDLRDLRARIARGESWPTPAWSLRDANGHPLDWFDAEPISAL